MYVPLVSVGLGLMIVATNAQGEDDDTYPPRRSTWITSTGSYSTDYGPSTSTVDDYPGCLVPHAAWVGDGLCDDFGNFNTEACGYDGGDCCECDCSHGAHICGAERSYACANPDSNCYWGYSLPKCSNGVLGFEGSNENGSACCPLGCNQCGGTGCAQSGAGQDLDNTDCCINGVLNNQDSCDVTGTAPCVIEDLPECVEGIEGYLGENANGSVCCPVDCTTCGGTGCATVGSAEGLDNTDCCINGVLNNQDSCESTGEAPCVL